MDKLFENYLNFDDFYKTADILLCKEQTGLNYLRSLQAERKQNLFTLAEEDGKLPFYSWKNFKNRADTRGDTAKAIYKVPSEIKLYPDNIKTTMGYDYNLGMTSDITKSGVFGTIQNLAMGAAQFNAIWDAIKNNRDKDGNLTENGMKNLESSLMNLKYQDRVNIFKNVPYFQDISTSSIDSISFTFNWGQYGLYNCELEVVKPIFALANCFGCSINGNGFVESPYDAKFQVATKAYTQLFSKTKGAISNAINKIKSGKSDDDGNTTKISELTTSLNEIYTNAVGETSLTGALFRIGAGIFGPVYVSDVTWEFDYSQQDEYGMPFKGKITLGGIKPIIIEDISSMALSGGVRIDK